MNQTLVERFREANSPETSDEKLKLLSLDSDPVVRAALLHNKKIPLGAKEILFNDRSEIVQEALKVNNYPVLPVITKCKEIVGRTVILRDADVSDAQFIVQLRNDEKKGRFISATSSDVSAQVNWLNGYKNSTNQAYFIINDMNGKRLGTVRIYDQQEYSFCWGSWILSSDAPGHFAVESALMVYKYALKLGFTNAHFSVTKGNSSVMKFHERFGAKLRDESDEECFYTISNGDILNSLNKYKKFLPEGISISL
ncbi:GNAT family N-acetyltransferase [Citrobacter freundii]|nr:GNAT family N-acetyltransferase [Citrobacter freundii]